MPFPRKDFSEPFSQMLHMGGAVGVPFKHDTRGGYPEQWDTPVSQTSVVDTHDASAEYQNKLRNPRRETDCSIGNRQCGVRPLINPELPDQGRVLSPVHSPTGSLEATWNRRHEVYHHAQSTARDGKYFDSR